MPMTLAERALAPPRTDIGARRVLKSPGRGLPRRLLYGIGRVLDDAVLVFFAVLALPLSILLVGTGIAACVWAIRQIPRLF